MVHSLFYCPRILAQATSGYHIQVPDLELEDEDHILAWDRLVDGWARITADNLILVSGMMGTDYNSLYS